MLLSQQDTAYLVEKAAFLSERTSPDFTSGVLSDSDRRAARERIERWIRSCAQGDESAYHKRLAWDGLDPARAESLAAGVTLADPGRRPSWISTLQGLTGAIANGPDLGEPRPERFLKAEQPFAFEELWSPVVVYAREQLLVRSAEAYALLADAAHASLERNLFEWVCAVSAETLELEFSAFRTLRNARAGFGAGWFGHLGGTPSRTLYLAFLQSLKQGGLVSFFRSYPVLARLLATVTDLWISFVAEFCSHVQQDLPRLTSMFDARAGLGLVVSAEAGLSDRHHGGRTSIRVGFESGVRCIYKPKDISAEALYYGLLEWLNVQGFPLPFKIFRSLDCGGHGWVELVPHLPCQDAAEVDRYYRRAGVLLCVVYVLEGSDCHHENIIASGEHPVLIDMETLLQHRVRTIDQIGEGDATMVANRVFYWDSVFRTALLPRWEFGPAGESYDISGLGGVDSQPTSFKRKFWEHINTDSMKLQWETIRTSPDMNVVRLNGERVNPHDYLDQIVDGFQTMYRFFQSHAPALLVEGGPISAMARMRLRFIFRHTKIYTTLLKTYVLPQNMRDGMDASIQLDFMTRPLLFTPERHPFWDVIAAEVRSILQSDIPLFTTCADSTALQIGGGLAIDRFFAEPSFQLLHERFRKLSDADLALQCSFIRSSFPRPAALVAEPAAADKEAAAESTGANFTDEAVSIADQIARSAISSPDGSATWITVAYYAEAQRWQLQPMSARMYDGASGVALFLAAVEHVTGGAGFRSLALSALKPAVANLDRADVHRVLFEPGIGAGLGGGSLIYALVRCARWLQDDSLLADARRVAALITPERIQTDRRFDLLGGAAGAAIVLLDLYQTSPEDELLERATACGWHLLEHRTPAPGGVRGWATLGPTLATGFSHGAAGIGWALLRIYCATGVMAFREGAAEAFAFENLLFDEASANWADDIDVETGKRGAFLCRWCHGAPGIALGRMAGLAAMDNPGIRSDIDRGLSRTASEPIVPLDHVCCGNLGRAEVFLTAGRILQNPEYTDRAVRIGTEVVARAHRSGQYGLGWQFGLYIPSLFQGMAGIGYQLLRLSNPERVPSILSWE